MQNKRTRRQKVFGGDNNSQIPKSGRISPPTGNRRHTTAIREGKISAEVFCRDPERREQLGLSEIRVEND